MAIGILQRCTGFDWDESNIAKNWESHQVSHLEAEQVFFNHPLMVADDKKHSDKEKRWLLLGKTDAERLLSVIFTMRKKSRIRVISARDMSKKERVIYEKISKRDS